MCDTVCSLIEGLYGYLNDGNVSSFCTYVQTIWPDVLSQKIYVELVFSMIYVYVEAYLFVYVGNCLELFDDIFCVI